jgi:hypothetical protein
MTPPKVLLIGYSGAGHTGAEALFDGSRVTDTGWWQTEAHRRHGPHASGA